MAKMSSTFNSIGFTTATLGTATGASGWVEIVGGSTTQLVKFSEVYMGGEASTQSTVAAMVFGRVGTLATATLTSTGASTNYTDILFAAPSVIPATYTGGTAGPLVSTTSQLLRLSFNSYGGIVRWVSSPDQQLTMYGNAAAGTGAIAPAVGGAVALVNTSASTNTISGHVLYEVI